MKKIKRVIALGFFDGVHLGHGALLTLCIWRATKLKAIPSALTFDLHPSALIPGKEPVPLLTTPAVRSGLMEQLYGIRDVLITHYDEAMMTTPWRQFVTDYLLREHGAVHLVVGQDFRFGYRGEGDSQKLRELCRELGIGCDVLPQIKLEGITVSSTYIRSLLSQGNIRQAVRFMGHPHILTDCVSHGKKLGSRLGFPTVNLRFSPDLLVPAHGVYACKAVFENGDSRLAVTNIGTRPTVNDGDAVTAEGFLLDFAGDLYNQNIRMEFFHYLRPERKFDSLEDLRAEVMRNAEQTRNYFSRP